MTRERENFTESEAGFTQPSKAVNVVIGRRIQELRAAVDVSRRDVAAVLGIPIKQLRAIEYGNKIITAEMLYRLATKYGLDMQYFFQDLDALNETPVRADIAPYISRELPRLFAAYLSLDSADAKRDLVALVEAAAGINTA